MAAPVSTCYISGACNRVPHCLDWGKNNLICYGICNSVAIYNPKVGNSSLFLHHPTKRRLSGPDYRRTNMWQGSHKLIKLENTIANSSLNDLHFYKKQFKRTCSLVGHTDVVNVASAIYSNFEKRHKLVATASSDYIIRTWHLTNDQNESAISLQTINLITNFALDIALAFHPRISVPFLIYGGSDTKLHFYSQEGNEFRKLVSLAGHEDWIRAINIMTENSGDLLIATCAQDCLIRLWRLKLDTNEAVGNENEIKLKGHFFTICDYEGKEFTFSVGLDAVIAGHEGWIYGLHWHPKVKEDQPLQLLSASMDKTMILWELDTSLGVWMEKVRVGEVGGNTLGFFGNRFSPSGQSIIAHGFQGAFHLWNFDTELAQWRPGVTVGGHFDEVLDLDWDSGGQFVITVSLDQTTRLHAPWRSGKDQETWFEMARPQIHGYDMTCVTVIGRHKFASGADEKVLRSFVAPKNFVENFSRLCLVDLIENSSERDTIPEGASIPALGLSNKAVFEKSSQIDTEARHQKDIYPEAYFSSTELIEPPTEETLLQNTLWPEVHKMYGHGYEIFCVASNRDGSLLASACKAAQSDHAKIIIWSIATWKEIGQLSGHSLTVTQMEFSPCGKYLLAVSRDRTWSLHELQLADNNDLTSLRVAYSDKKTSRHNRIIWSCSWSHDSSYFVTGSRDKKVIIWGYQSRDDSDKSCLGQWGVSSTVLEMEDSVTAVAFAPILTQDQSYLLAVGLDSGSMFLYKWNKGESEDWQLSYIFQNAFHHSTVKRLRFCPTVIDQENMIRLASCGSDHLLYIFNISWQLL